MAYEVIYCFFWIFPYLLHFLDETPGSSHEQVAPIRAPAKAALTEATQRAVPAAPSAQSTLASVGGMSFKRFLSQLEIDLIEVEISCRYLLKWILMSICFQSCVLCLDGRRRTLCCPTKERRGKRRQKVLWEEEIVSDVNSNISK